MEDKQTLDLLTPDNGDEAAPIEQHASHAYLGYAVSTVKARALPEIADGLKPVQRRILFSMNGSTTFSKCARYVGEVLGKYHPHGDSSTYEALVHVAQPFSMRYPLIEGQGNFGSRDGDAPAAYRYTEARLSRFAELLLAEIGEGTVDFTKNYDGKFDEPVLLPARLPFGLLNGSFGIPVGFSTRIPSHNLKEVAAAAAHVIKHPRAKLDEVLKIMPGPDFPGGAQVISPPEEIGQAYETGRGSIVLKCKWDVEQLARGQWRIVITELPHGVSAKQVLQELDALADPKPGFGKKEVTQEQKRLRQFILDQIEKEGVRDESDRKSKLRLVIEPRSSRQNPDELMAALLVHTSLESRYAVNLTWLGRDGLPETKGIVEALREWGDWRLQTVRRRTQFRLARCEERLHIVLGRLMAYVKIDEIIKLIRASEDQAEARKNLQAKFRFTEKQAEDIVNLRLGQLTRLDGVKLNEERKALEAERRDLKLLLQDEKELKKLVIAELNDDARKYGDERRTLIKAGERAQIERRVVEEPITVVLSRKGWIRARSGFGLDVSSLTFKDGDALLQALECKTTDPVIVLTASGKTFTLDAAAIPAGRGDGAPVHTLVNSGSDDIVWIGSGDLATRLLMNSSAGLGFVCKLGDLVTKTRQGKDFFKVEEGAVVQGPAVVSSSFIACLSSDARLLVFPLEEVPERPNGGVGVQLLALPPDISLASVATTDGKSLVVSGIRRKNRASATLDAKQLAERTGKRAQRGRVCDVGFRPDRLGT
ncbi:MAG: DNA topoisomerase IV subunit A [Betaproteobacteria bacterium]